MKHLIAKEHHRHLKKRAAVELVGLIVLIAISISQRSVIADSLHAIASSDALSLLLLIACYWLLLPLTAISYQMLTTRRIRLGSTALAQLAAAGPGRIIPGGLGHLSIAAAHLSREGVTLRKAVVISVANNLFGLATNSVIVVLAVLIKPKTWHTVTENISTVSVLLICIVLLAIAVIFIWLSHAHSTRNTIRKVHNEWIKLAIFISKRPQRLLVVILIAVIILFGHIAMLLLAGTAVSVTITITDALLALSVGVLLGGAIPTPGGIGAVEAGTSTSLVILGYSPEQAVSTALLFRAITYWMPLLPGTFAYIYLRRRSRI